MRKNGKLIAITIALTMLVSFITPALAMLPEDVAGSPYAEAIEKMMNLGVFQGFPDDTFRPDENMTRAQAAKIIAYLIGKGADVDEADAEVTTIFPDLPAGHWAAGYINICVDMGVYEGFPDGTFKPEEKVTQRQLAVLLLRVLGHFPAWEEVDDKAMEVGLISWSYSADEEAPRGILALASYNTAFKIPRADGACIATEVFGEDSISPAEEAPVSGAAPSLPSSPQPGNGAAPADPVPGAIDISVIVTELRLSPEQTFKTYTVTVHSIDIVKGHYWSLGCPDSEKKEAEEEYTKGSTEDRVDLYIFDSQGKVLKTFQIEYRDYDHEVLE